MLGSANLTGTGLGSSVNATRELSCNWIRDAFASWTTAKLQSVGVQAWAKHVRRGPR